MRYKGHIFSEVIIAADGTTTFIHADDCPGCGAGHVIEVLRPDVFTNGTAISKN